MRRKKHSPALFILLVITGIGLVSGYFFLHSSTKDTAIETVDTFYSHEQNGAFSESWAMFHPQMKEKVSKVDYLQDRPEMLYRIFGAETFTYTLENAEKIERWAMESGAEPIDNVYKVNVTQSFQGKYGRFHIERDVYTTEMDGKWLILWDYEG